MFAGGLRENLRSHVRTHIRIVRAPRPPEAVERARAAVDALFAGGDLEWLYRVSKRSRMTARPLLRELEAVSELIDFGSAATGSLTRWIQVAPDGSVRAGRPGSACCS